MRSPPRYNRGPSRIGFGKHDDEVIMRASDGIAAASGAAQCSDSTSDGGICVARARLLRQSTEVYEHKSEAQFARARPRDFVFQYRHHIQRHCFIAYRREALAQRFELVGKDGTFS